MIKMNEEEFEDFKNYIIKYRNLTNDLANKCITPYMLEQFRGYNDRFDYEPDLFSKYNVPNRIDELQQRYKQLQNNWNELKKGLQSLFEFDEGVVSKDYLECAKDTLEKMQELEKDKEWKE